MIDFMNYMFRPYRGCDKKSCERIIAPTWRFDKYFPDAKNISFFNGFVIDWFRLHSDYTDTAIVKTGAQKGKCTAFLFAEIKCSGLQSVPNAMKKKVRLTFFFVKIFMLWLLGCYGKRSTARKAFRDYKAVQKKLFNDIDYDSEILCLFVDKAAQGQGLAKHLLKRFFEWAAERDLTSFVLATDTDCDYRFYDKGGFTRIKEIRGCLGVPQSSSVNSRIFLYGICLKGTV
ncbi:GNAT family N-acetyltransferase [Treponema sp. OMZ 840]|uniref:GNAT family N-acetyltransferase n=1 Tax=Treponema sp. OMZ 840 TaxID=244313 RepID=UPI003D8EB857